MSDNSDDNGSAGGPKPNRHFHVLIRNGEKAREVEVEEGTGLLSIQQIVEEVRIKK